MSGVSRAALEASRAAAPVIPDPVRLVRWAGFALVGVSGIPVNLAMMWLLADPATLHLDYALAAVLATQVSSTWNFLLADRLVFHGPKLRTTLQRWAAFLAMSNLVLVLRIPALALLISVLHIHYLVATAITLALGFAVRFRTQERLTLGKA